MNLAWSELSFWDLWKAIAVALTGLFGILGLLTNYKDKATGRITVWGKINLAGIVLSATMGVLSQLVDAQHKTASARDAAASAAASARLAVRTSAQAQAAATQARTAATNTARLIGDLLRVSQATERSVANSRTAAEAGQTAASRTLGVARGTAQAVSASQAGLARIERLLSPFAEPTLQLSSQLVDRKRCLAKPDKLAVTLMIMRPLAPKLPKHAADLLGIQSPDTTYNGDGKLEWQEVAPDKCRFQISASLSASWNDLEVLSYLDLPGKEIIVYVEGMRLARADLSGVSIQTRDGQHFHIPLSDTKALFDSAATGDADKFGFSYVFPADRDPRAREDSSQIF